MFDALLDGLETIALAGTGLGVAIASMFAVNAAIEWVKRLGGKAG
jgi:hypothetical protein